MPERHDISCPFCGLLCDDLSVNSDNDLLTPCANACEISRRSFADMNILDTTADSANIDKAIKHAAAMLDRASSPLILVANADVAGARASVRLAEQCGGVIDHVNSAALMRNLSVLQYSGWFTATFAEVRNRSDLIVVVGDTIFERFPRLIERVLIPENGLLDDRLDQRKFILIGPWNEKPLPDKLNKQKPTVVDTKLSQATKIVSLLRDARSAQATSRFDVEPELIDLLNNLTCDINNATYTSVVWSAGDFDFLHSELLVQNLVEWVRELNKESRAVALPVGGSNGDLTLNQVCTWHCGLPIRTSFARGYPQHDPILFDYRRLLDTDETDLLLVVGQNNMTCKPSREIDYVEIGANVQQDNAKNRVHIQTGVPGVLHRGHMFRGDGVVSIPLRQLQVTGLPSPAQALDQISYQLRLI